MEAYIGEDLALENIHCTFGVDADGNLTQNYIAVTFVTTGRDGLTHEVVISGEVELFDYGTTTVTLPDLGDRTELVMGKPTAESVESTDASDFGASVLALVNSFRNDAGLDSLKYSSAMQKAADTRAKECAVSFSHTRPDGSSSYTALTERSISFTAFGENIFAATGMDSVSAEFVVEQWMASQGHRENILRDGFTHMCIGVAAKDDEVYVVQLFGAGIS